MTQPKATTPNPRALPVGKELGQTKEQALARAALNPAINSAAVMGTYQENLMGEDLDMGELLKGLRECCEQVHSGDLTTLEAMLVTQATTLQTMFASLARRAANQEQLRQYETFMGLALRAQSQSRATISALVDLKFPRQATFVKQANIAHGPQQVNNGTTTPGGIAHAKKTEDRQNELLEYQHGNYLDTRTQSTAGRIDPHLEAVEPVHRPKKPRR